MNAAAGGEPAQVAAGPSTPGELLRRERESRHLSIQQAAEDLHLDPWVIEAIEANRFVALGAPVYAKGHLRKYAMLLGLAPEPVLERYQALSDTPIAPTPIPASVTAPLRTERISLKTPLLVAASVLALGAAWWAVDRLTGAAPSAPAAAPESSPASEEMASPPASPGAAASTARHTVEARQPAPASAASGRAALIASAPVPAPVVAAASGSQIRLRLAFSDASWTEVYDADGKRLMFAMGAPGRVRMLAGTPPLNVTLGVASAVSVQVNDEPIVIPRRAGKDAAKFVIDAAGAVTPGSRP